MLKDTPFSVAEKLWEKTRYRVVWSEQKEKSNSIKLVDSSAILLLKHGFIRRILTVAWEVCLAYTNSLKVKKYGILQQYEKWLKTGNTYRGIFPLVTREGFVVLITDLSLIRTILQRERNETGPNAIFSGGITTQIARAILGNNFFTCPDQEHAVFRTFAKPLLFKREHLATFLPRFHQQSNVLIDRWFSHDSSTITISKDLHIFSAETVARNLLGYEGEMEVLCKAMHDSLRIYFTENPTAQDSDIYKNALDTIGVAAKMACASERDCFLKSMSLAKDNEGKPIFTEEEVLSNAKIMFFAGQDTTGCLLTYLFYILGQEEHSHWQDKLFNEAQQFLDSKDYESLSQSILLNNLINEALRLCPPSYNQSRLVIQDVLINNQYYIPAGTSIYMMHYFYLRDPAIWGDDAECFNPERFDNKNPNQPILVFSAGPTSCLGRQFILPAVSILLLNAARCFRWESVTKKLNLVPRETLYLEPDLQIKMELR